mgnify:CR=1 FL=1
MTSRRYKAGQNHHQASLLPASIYDYVGENDSVRAISAYVNTLNLAKLGFKNTQQTPGNGQPAFDSANLLKLYLYGYINKIRTNRSLE